MPAIAIKLLEKNCFVRNGDFKKGSWGMTVVDVGGTNVALEEFPEMSWSKVNFERVLSLDPDIVVIPGRENATLMTEHNSLKGTSWGQLDAVKERKVYDMLIGAKDLNAFFDWTPRMLIGEMQLARYLQPAYFGTLDIHSAADALFLKYYDISHVQQS